MQNRITRPHLNNFFVLFVAIVSPTFLSGCVVSFTNPLPSTQPTRVDERLLGEWEGKDEAGTQTWVRITKASGHEMDVSLRGFPDFENTKLRVLTTSISGSDYMIIRVGDPDRRKDYMIAKYTLGDDKLTVCMLNAQKIKEAIKKRTLKGNVGDAQWGGAVITESSNHIVKFLTSPNTKDLFACLPELKKASAK